MTNRNRFRSTVVAVGAAFIVGGVSTVRAADMELAPPPSSELEAAQPEIAAPPAADFERAQPELAQPPPADFEQAQPELDDGEDDD